MTDFTQQSSAPNFTPFGAAPAAGVAPQGFDFEGLLKQVAGQAVQALPGIIMGLLSSNPVIGPQLKAQNGVAPQSLFSFGGQTPIGNIGISLFDSAPQAGGVNPQFNLGNLLKDIGKQAISALPGIVMGLLSSHPVLGPQLKAQGVAPQSLFNFGIQTPIGGGGISLFDAAPQAGGVNPQFNLGKMLQDVAGEAVKVLPGLLMGLLSSHPVLGPQLKAQGVSPQSLINFGFNTPIGGGGINLFDSAPQVGGVSPQGFDFGKLLDQVANEAAKAIPGIVNGIVQQLLPQAAMPRH